MYPNHVHWRNVKILLEALQYKKIIKTSDMVSVTKLFASQTVISDAEEVIGN